MMKTIAVQNILVKLFYQMLDNFSDRVYCIINLAIVRENIGMQFKPVRPSRISSEVSDQIKQAILLGDFKGGEKLPTERALSEQFRVSRMTMREALRTLENAGFVETRLGATGGVFVTELGFECFINSFTDLFLAKKISILEIYQLRLVMEPEIARLAALRITPKYAKRLRETPNMEHRMLHFILAEMSGNCFFEQLVKISSDLTKNFVETAKMGYVHPEGHSAILEAVLAGDSKVAAEAMRKHIIENGKLLTGMEELYLKKQRNTSHALRAQQRGRSKK